MSDGLLNYTDIERDADKKHGREKLERLRDEFAMSALTGLLSAVDSNGQWTWGTAKDVVDCAFDIADEALKAREVKS